MIIITEKTALPFTTEEIDTLSYNPDDYGRQSNVSWPHDWPENKTVATHLSYDYVCLSIKAPDGRIMSLGDGYNTIPDKGYCIQMKDGSFNFHDVEELCKYGSIGDCSDESSLICNDHQTGEIVDFLAYPVEGRPGVALKEVNQQGYELVRMSDVKREVAEYKAYIAQRTHERNMRNDDLYAARYLRAQGKYAEAKARAMNI